MSHHANKVQEQFGAVAEQYLTSTVHRQGADLATVANRLRNSSANTRVLDLGCGAGHLSFAIAPHVESVIAYDLSSDMLRVVAHEAQQRGIQSLVTRQGHAESLPFEVASFDWVCTRYSAHHWTDVRMALREVRRVLKPGGTLIVIDISAPTCALLDTHLQAIELLRDGSHVRNYSSMEWASMLKEAGFRLSAQSSWKLPLDFTAWVGRMNTPALYVQAIRSLLQKAPQEVRNYFQISSDGSFTPDAHMMEAN